ncbi:MAG: signal peptide peptidase SppA [Elusimicrobia bacterium]|jgi:protease-4|nr:signal peptide peptidase SppA [Elusimicrobiota bacterium]
MVSKKLTGILILLLLITSIISAVLLSLKQSVKQTSISIDNITGTRKNYIGVVDINGPIYSSSQSGGFGMRYGVSNILQILREFKDKSSIKGVIIRINSPGGTVGAVQEIAEEIKRVKAAGKPVVASVADISASGGYYIASVCDKIIVNPGSIVGSIGVIFTTAELSELFNKVGINMEVIKSGPYKDVGSAHRPLKEEEKKFLQEVVDDTYNQFITEVSEGRGMDIEKVKELAKGQIYSGRQAKTLNLVDELGDIMVAKDLVQELAGEKDAKLYRPHYSGWKQLINLMEQRTNILGFRKDRITGAAYLWRP